MRSLERSRQLVADTQTDIITTRRREKGMDFEKEKKDILPTWSEYNHDQLRYRMYWRLQWNNLQMRRDWTIWYLLRRTNYSTPGLHFWHGGDIENIPTLTNQ